jgi:hypothetical protein
MTTCTKDNVCNDTKNTHYGLIIWTKYNHRQLSLVARANRALINDDFEIKHVVEVSKPI